LLLVVLVSLAGLMMWRSGYLPLRLRDDGIYGGNQQSPAGERALAETMPRPMLYLPAPERVRRGFLAVERVVDGDTIIVRRGTERERVRLIGIDCPEIGRNEVDPHSPGWLATMFVFSLLEPNAQVRLDYDSERTDRFDRTLAYVYLPDGRMLNEVLMEEGWAKVMRIPPNTRHADRFAELQSQARSQGKGMWKSH